MSELTVEQVEWLENYLITIIKPGSAGDDIITFPPKPYDLTQALIADWHRQRKEIERLWEELKFISCYHDEAIRRFGTEIATKMRDAAQAAIEKGPQG